MADKQTISPSIDTVSETQTETRIIAQRCPTKLDRIFLTIPADRVDWKNYVNQVKKSQYHAAERLWSVPRTKELHKQFAAYFGESLFVDNQNSIILTEGAIPSTPPQYPRFEDKITIFERHAEAQVWSIHLPKPLIQKYLVTIKKIGGRKWDNLLFVWEVPKTKITERFIHKYLNDVVHWACVARADLPERLTPTPQYQKTEVNVESPPPINASADKVGAMENAPTVSSQPLSINAWGQNNTLFDQLNAKQKVAVSKLENLLILERKAYHTQKGYRNIFIQFLTHYKDTLPSLITAQQIEAYILMRIKNDNVSKSTQNQMVSTFKAFYGRLMEQHDKVTNLYRPNKEEHLPKTLSPEEITRLFAKVTNIKHRCILSLLFGSGLRVGEVVRLKWQDLDFVEKTVFIHNGKNYKDRYTILSVKSMDSLHKYNAEYKPTDWVFESPDGGHYSERSVQQFFSEAMAKAKIDKQVNTHSLRHAFATQLLKAHEDIDFVRKVMGHASIKTTQIYLHVVKTELTKTKSPLDDLDI